MVVTLEDLIKKYPTKIDLNKMSKGLKEVLVTEGNIDNVKKPKILKLMKDIIMNFWWVKKHSQSVIIKNMNGTI